MVSITVHGIPAPQGSKRFVGTAKSGRGIMVESSKAVKPWREAVKFACLDAMSRLPAHECPSKNPFCRCIHGPIQVDMIFKLPKPKSAPKKSRSYPDRKPDLSKLIRSTEDAIVDAGLIEDDARIVSILAFKEYPGDVPDGLGVPGAKIIISPAEGKVDDGSPMPPGELARIAECFDPTSAEV